MLKIDAIPAFDDNYIWLISRTDSDQAVVVDPGDGQAVQAVLDANKLTLNTILITHHHFDHVGGIEALCKDRQVHVIGPQNPAIEGLSQRVQANDTCDVLGISFTVKEVPGHTLDHIAYFASNTDTATQSPVLFCGDALFAGGCGRMFEGNPTQMCNSLAVMRDLPEATQVYCAHEYTLANLNFALAVEPDNKALSERYQQAQALRDNAQATVPSTIGLERKTNPFLRTHLSDIVQAAQKQAGATLSNESEVFATIRGWKDNF